MKKEQIYIFAFCAHLIWKPVDQQDEATIYLDNYIWCLTKEVLKEIPGLFSPKSKKESVKIGWQFHLYRETQSVSLIRFVFCVLMHFHLLLSSFFLKIMVFCVSLFIFCVWLLISSCVYYQVIKLPKNVEVKMFIMF